MSRRMKDSGIEWIGEIPEEWEIYTLSKIASIKTGSTPHNKVLNEEKGLDWIKTNNLNAEKGVSNSKQKIYLEKKHLVPIAEKGSTLVSCIGDIGKMAYITKPVSYNQQINSVYFKDNIYPKFGFYSLYTQKDQHKSLSNGNVLHILNSVNHGFVKLAFPDFFEQKKISNYLDVKTKKIEEIKNVIKNEIKTLEDYKKSIITEAVTKGLDKNVEMKDSGIEWIGEIPEHWKVIRIKNCSLLKARIGWQGLRSDEFMMEDGLPYLVTGTDFKEGYVDWDNCVRISEKRFEMDKNIQIKEKDLLITKDGTIGKIAIAKNCPEKASLNSGIFVMRNQGSYKYVDKYMYYLLQSEQFLLWFELNEAGNSTIRHLYQKDFYNFSFSYPNLEEQQLISDYLDKKCKLIDDSISIKKQQLETLEEYKKSLIYEYVTGKKEVKDV